MYKDIKMFSNLKKMIGMNGYTIDSISRVGIKPYCPAWWQMAGKNTGDTGQ